MKQSSLIFVHLLNDYSGSPRVLRDAIEAIEYSGEKYIFTSNHHGFLDELGIVKIPIFYKYSDKKIYKLFFYLLSQLHLFLTLSHLIIKIRIRGDSTTLIVNTLLPFAAGLAGKLFSNKVVYYIHESYISPRLLKSFLRAVVNITAEHVIFVSNYLKWEEGLSKPQQSVIHNGLRKDFDIEPTLDFSSKFSGKYIFFAGSLKEYKGIYQFIKLAQKLPQFSFVGALNCEINEFDKFMLSANLGENIRFLIRPTNIAELFSKSFCVVNLTLPDQCIETFGLSLLEGMSYGCPAIAPPVGGPLEIVNNANGLICSPYDLDTISDFLISLSSNYALWEKYSINAQESAKNFSPEIYQNKINSFLNENELL